MREKRTKNPAVNKIYYFNKNPYKNFVLFIWKVFNSDLNEIQKKKLLWKELLLSKNGVKLCVWIPFSWDLFDVDMCFSDIYDTRSKTFAHKTLGHEDLTFF